MKAMELKEHLQEMAIGVLITACSVCDEVLKIQDYQHPMIEISHGYCPKHFEEAMRELEKMEVECKKN